MRLYKHVVIRVSVSILSVLLAIVYSLLLGPERRSVMVFVFVSSAIYMQLFLLPYSYKYRSLHKDGSLGRTFHFNYFSRVVIASILSLPIGILLLWFYSSATVNLPFNIFLIVSIYWLLAHISFSLQDYLQVTNHFKLDSAALLIGFFVQLVTLVFLTQKQIFSIFTSIILSLCANSLTRIVITLYIFNRFKEHTTDENTSEPLVSELASYLQISSPNLIEIYLKLLIGFLLPLEVLAKYSLLVAVYTPIRAFADSLIRYKLQYNLNLPSVYGRFGFVLVFLTFCVFILGVSWFTNRLIIATLGNQWVFPLLTTWAVLLYEFLRNLNYVRFSRLFARGLLPRERRRWLFLLCFTLPILMLQFGLVGAVPILMLFSLISRK